MTASTKPKIVRIKIERGDTGLMYATSPDLKGLFVADRTLEDVERAIPKTIAAIFAARGIRVIVTKGSSDVGSYIPWLAAPTEDAKANI
jgi:hypothetical protein